MEDLNTLQTEIEMSRGKGNIIVCMANTPLLRNRIIEELSKTFILRRIRVRKGEDIIEPLKSARKEPMEMKYDAWIWIMPEKGNAGILDSLNNFRELFYDVNTPSLILCNRGFLDTIIREAPDFWRYRGNYYEFEYDQELRPLPPSEAFEFPFFYRSKEELQRRKRIIEYLLRRVEDPAEEADLKTEMALIYFSIGELNKTMEYLEDALRIHQEHGDKINEAADLGNIGLIYWTKGELDEALKYYQEALQIYREMGHRQGEANQLGNIGVVYRLRGDLDEALKYHQEALQIHREMGHRQGEANQLGNISVVYRLRRDLYKALRYHQEALQIHREMGHKVGEASDLGNIGVVYQSIGVLDEALKYCQEALQIHREMGHKRGEATDLMNLGIILQKMGKEAEALGYLHRALDIYENIGARRQADLTNERILEISPQEV